MCPANLFWLKVLTETVLACVCYADVRSTSAENFFPSLQEYGQDHIATQFIVIPEFCKRLSLIFLLIHAGLLQRTT